jgi:hypothetical protein
MAAATVLKTVCGDEPRVGSTPILSAWRIPHTLPDEGAGPW